MGQSRSVTARDGTAYEYGFSESRAGSISVLAPRLYPQFASGACLITKLDSSRPVSELTRFMARLTAACRPTDGVTVVDGAVLITGAALRWVFLGGETFTFFDEIYLFDRKPNLAASPEESYTSEAYPFADEVPEALLSYVVSSQAVAFLADGMGLNYLFRQDHAAPFLSILERPNE
jgi:hypothetical protein